MTILEGIIIGAVAVKLYNILFTPEERKIIENKVKTHHFEYGVAATGAGILAKSPTTVGTGVAWMLDDWKDKDIAILNLQRKVDSVVNQLKQVLGT